MYMCRFYYRFALVSFILCRMCRANSSLLLEDSMAMLIIVPEYSGNSATNTLLTTTCKLNFVLRRFTIGDDKVEQKQQNITRMRHSFIKAQWWKIFLNAITSVFLLFRHLRWCGRLRWTLRFRWSVRLFAFRWLGSSAAKSIRKLGH